MRILSYNILEGGNLRDGDRTLSILKLIQEFDPDILGIAECTQWERDENKRLKLFENALCMVGVMNSAPSGHHVALLYKPALAVITEDASSTVMYNGLVRLQVELATIGKVTVIMSHLHPYSSWQRTAEAQTLVGKTRATADAIVMGDFNTVVASEVTPELRSAPEHFRTRLLGPDGEFDSTPLSLFMAHSFIDLGAARKQPTYPTCLGDKRARYGTMARLDFIFATPRLASRCQQFFTIDDTAAQSASDHLPIGCVIE